MQQAATQLAEVAGDGDGALSLLSAVLESERVGVAIYLPVDEGRDYLHVYVNPTYRALKPSRPMAGRRYSEVWPELIDFALPKLNRVLESGDAWIAREQPLKIEVAEDLCATRYFTFEIQRLEAAGRTYLLNTAIEVTGEINVRRALVDERRELRQSERRFRAVLENSLDAAYRRDLRTDAYDYLSPVIERLTGFTPEEFATLPVEEVLARVHPEDLPAVSEALPAALESGILTVEYRLRKKDGGYVWLADHAVVVKNAHGEPLYLSGVIRDIGHSKQLELETQREHRRLQTLLDTLPVGVFISDSEGGLVYTNEQVAMLWGDIPSTATADEYGLYRAFRPETHERLKSEDWSGARALAGEATYGEVLEIERFDGTRRTILNSSVPIRDEQGAIIGQVTVEQDITEQRRAEESLRENEERLRLALDAARMAAWDYDPATLEIKFSENAEEVLELPAPYEDSDVQYDLIHADDVERHRALVNEAIETAGSYVSIYRHPRGDGEIWLEDHGRAVVDAKGKTTRLVGVVQNVTERLRIEQQLLEALDAQREAARYSVALNQVGADVAFTLDVNDIMRLILKRAAATVGADVGVIFLPVGEDWEARYTWQAPSWLQGSLVRSASIPYSADAARKGQAVLFERPSEHPGWQRSIARRLDARQVLDSPLTLGADEVAHMVLYKQGVGDFSEADRDFLQKASSAVSLALQNARRYEREREIADTLQEALLTVPDEVPRLELAHAYRSAAEAARVGGDFYDVFTISEDLVGIVIGDVAGKGLEASVLTSLAKDVIRAHATEKGAVPARILSLTNDAVYHETQGESFITVFFGTLDTGSGRLIYASAGHTTGALLTAQGAATRLPSTGPVLGAFPGMVFDEVEQSLDLDESLFLYTDGLTEARRDNELFGEDRLFEMLEHHQYGSPREAVRSIIDEALRFSGGHLNDDLAVLCVRRLSSTQEARTPDTIAV